MILATALAGKSIVTEVTVMSAEHPLQLTLKAFLTAALPNFQIRTEEVQLAGPPGPPPDMADVISTDANNRLTAGSDEKLYVPEVNTDLAALYILARN